MIEIDFRNMSRFEVGAIKECIDLCRNGYRVMVNSHVDKYIFIKLRHDRTGRILRMYVYPDRYTIRDGERIIKSVSS